MIGGSLGGAGVFNAASFSTLGDAVVLGPASIEWAGLARLIAGVGSAESATVKLNVAAQHNSRRELAMGVEGENQAVVSSRGVQFRNLQECLAVRDNRLHEKLTIALLLGQHCAP